MDIQKVRPNNIVTIDRVVAKCDLTGKICIPVSWLYFQMRESNIAEMSIEELQSSLGGRVCLDVMLNAKKDEKHKSTLRSIDACIMDLKNGTNSFYNFCDTKIGFFVNDRQVNVINFAHKLRDNLSYHDDHEEELHLTMNGSFANELDFNEHMLIMVKPYRIKLKRSTLLHNSSEFFT